MHICTFIFHQNDGESDSQGHSIEGCSFHPAIRPMSMFTHTQYILSDCHDPVFDDPVPHALVPDRLPAPK